MLYECFTFTGDVINRFIARYFQIENEVIFTEISREKMYLVQSMLCGFCLESTLLDYKPQSQHHDVITDYSNRFIYYMEAAILLVSVGNGHLYLISL